MQGEKGGKEDKKFPVLLNPATNNKTNIGKVIRRLINSDHKVFNPTVLNSPQGTSEASPHVLNIP